MVAYVQKLVKEARENSYLICRLGAKEKDKILKKMAQLLIKNRGYILKENRKDIDKGRRDKLSLSFLDRLKLNDKRVKEMSDSLREIAGFADPVNRVIHSWRRPNGLSIEKVSSPIGVILMIYEARPNVTSDCIGLCFKSSNIAILRGGSSALNSNRAIFNVLCRGITWGGIKFNPFFLIEKTSYQVVNDLLRQQEYIDLVIPRGGEALIRKVVNNSSISVIKHYKGVCHIFVDKFANLSQALKICVNAKVQRPAVCNAVETILVDKNIAKKFLPALKEEFDKYNVIIKGDSSALKIIKGIRKAASSDWSKEYLDLVVSLKVVKNIEEAINHINCYGSGHTDSIITEKINHAKRFVKEIDSACCFVNISTRFSDGYQFGLGAEIGISTDKLHARGPMGVKDLTTYKYVVKGKGQIRE